MRPGRSLTLLLSLVSCAAPVALAADGDLVFKRESQEASTPPAVFPHWFHRIRYTCYACHPDPFLMRSGAVQITMDDIMAGKHCGICHDGKTAWSVSFETCSRCHKEPR